jgi:hypothetical protein
MAATTAIQGTVSSTSNAVFEAAITAAIVPTPGAVLPSGQTLLPVVPPAFMNRGGNVDHSSIVPIEFNRLYAQLLVDNHRI